MLSLSENALTILRIMIQELKLGPFDRVQEADLIPLTHLDKAEFEKAVRYLLQQKYVTTILAGGHWEPTTQGISFLETAMSSRFPLSLDAERILRYCEDNPNSDFDGFFLDGEVKQVLGLDNTVYIRACRLLESFGFIKDANRDGKYEIFSITSQGSQAVHYNFQRQGSANVQTSSVNISGGRIYGSVVGNNTGSITGSYDLRKLELEIDQRGGEDAEALKALIRELEQLLAAKDTLDRGILARFSSLMERNSWITGAIAQALFGYAVNTSRF